MTSGLLLASFLFALFALFALFVRGGARNPLFLLGGFFVFFAYGPCLNLFLGNDVYAGTIVDEIPRVLASFTCFLTALVVAQYLPLGRRQVRATAVEKSSFSYPLLVPVWFCSITYALVILSARLPAFLSGSKSVQLDAAGPYHYVFLLLELAAVPLGLLLDKEQRGALALWRVNCAVYTVYCVATSERDFILAFVALAAAKGGQITKSNVKLGLMAVGGIAAGSWLFAWRSGTGVGIAEVLNQGSIPFVDSQIMNLYPHPAPFEHGATYVSSLLRLIPGSPARETLGHWFANYYASSDSAAYGFSFTAEAFMNFGFAGVFLITLVLAVSLRWLYQASYTSRLAAFGACYFTTILMYALRGDSTQLLRAAEFGLLVVLVCAITRLTRRDSGHRHLNGAQDSQLQS